MQDVADRIEQGEDIRDMNVESIGVSSFPFLSHPHDSNQTVVLPSFKSLDEYSSIIDSDFTLFEYSAELFKQKLQLSVGGTNRYQRMIKREHKAKFKQELKDQQSTKSSAREQSNPITKPQLRKINFRDWKKAKLVFGSVSEDESALISKIQKFTSAIKFQFSSHKNLAMLMRENSFYILKAVESLSSDETQNQSLFICLVDLFKELVVALTQEESVRTLLMSESGTRWFLYLEKLLKQWNKTDPFTSAALCWNLRNYLSNEDISFLSNCDKMLSGTGIKQKQAVLDQAIEILQNIFPNMHPQYLMPFLARKTEGEEPDYPNPTTDEQVFIETRSFLKKLVMLDIFKIGYFSSPYKCVKIGDAYIGINANYFTSKSETQLRAQFLWLMIEQLVKLKRQFSGAVGGEHTYADGKEHEWIRTSLRLGPTLIRKGFDQEGQKEFVSAQNWEDLSLFKKMYSKAYQSYKQEFINPKKKPTRSSEQVINIIEDLPDNKQEEEEFKLEKSVEEEQFKIEDNTEKILERVEDGVLKISLESNGGESEEAKEPKEKKGKKDHKGKKGKKGRKNEKKETREIKEKKKKNGLEQLTINIDQPLRRVTRSQVKKSKEMQIIDVDSD